MRHEADAACPRHLAHDALCVETVVVGLGIQAEREEVAAARRHLDPDDQQDAAVAALPAVGAAASASARSSGTVAVPSE